MGDLHEIVDAAAVERLFGLLAVLGPVVGLAAGAWIGARRQQVWRWTITGLLIGSLGALNFGMWRLYNAITDANGLDSVKGLAINFVLFILVGAGVGFGYTRLRPAAVIAPEIREEPAES